MKSIATRRRKGLVLPLALIFAGLVFFLERNGLLERQAIFQMMPLLPVLIGGSLLVSRLRRAG